MLVHETQTFRNQHLDIAVSTNRHDRIRTKDLIRSMGTKEDLHK